MEHEISKYQPFDHLLEGAQVISPDFRYFYVNETVANQGKTTVRKLTGNSMLEMYPGIEKTEMFSFLTTCMKTGKPHQMENRFEFPDGSDAWFELRFQRVPEGVLILSFDITSRKHAEELLSSHYVSLLEKKNQELEKFAYVAAHDLQAPLVTVKSFMDFFQKKYGQMMDDQAVKSINHIQRILTRMKVLIQRLLEYSKTGKNSDIGLIDLNDTIHEIKKDISALINESNAIITYDPLPEIKGSEREYRMLFQNLIVNAIKFRKDLEAPKVHISYKLNTDNHLFCVEDNGIGIRKEDQERIFQILERVENGAGAAGTGIGLAICKKIVSFHNGKIWIESDCKSGSKFFISIPLEN